MKRDKKRLGVIINPIAGIGGRVGLKGSDGADILEKALTLGAEPEAPRRAGYALSELQDSKNDIQVLTYGGEMGARLLQEMGFEVQVVGVPDKQETTAQDTMDAARSLQELDVDLILFAGGDGTARNIYEAIGDKVPVIGIPAGVKIHSAVFATSARNAGLAAKSFLEGYSEGYKLSEVMDIDEEAFRDGRLSAQLFGYMKVPETGGFMQHTKSASSAEKDELMGVVGHIISRMETDTLYIVGPGSTTRAIIDELQLQGTLLGVDVISSEGLIASDVSESELWDLIKDPDQKVKLIVTIIGGQGNLFGRGNQQISPRVIRRVGRKHIIVAATGTKLTALYNQPLLVDTGDPELDRELKGYIEVVKDFAHTVIYPVSD